MNSAAFNGLITYLKAGGILTIPLALIAFGIWQQYLTLLFIFKKQLHNSNYLSFNLPETSEQFLSEAPKLLNKRPGMLPALIKQVIASMRNGLGFRDSFLQKSENLLAPFTYSFYLLGAMVTAAPLLGLLGTVLGMVQTFHGLGDNAQTELVALGISRALTTTQIGLAAALPGAFGLAHLFRLYRQLQNSVSLCESRMSLVFEHGEIQ